MSQDGALSLRGITKSYGGVQALAPTDLDVAAGEFLTLLGPSGCGKTTLLRIIAGLISPDGGTIELDGADIGGRPAERRPFNMVFQSYALFPHMTVAQNVGYGPRLAGTSPAELKRRVGDALELVGLTSYGDRLIGDLSGGQQQRVALVRALVNEPRILLLDEPLGALDLQLRKRLQRELRDLQHRLGTTFVFVTHDQEEALTLSTRIAVMQDGAIVQIGTPQEVYERPRSRFVAEFVGEASLVPATLISRSRGTAVVRLPDGAQAEVPCHGPRPVEADERCLVALRPEHVTLEATNGASLRGRLHGSVFRGADTAYEVRLADGTVVAVRSDGVDDPAIGDPVVLGLRPGRGAVVAFDTSAIDPGG